MATARNDIQQAIDFGDTSSNQGVTNLPDVFKKIYFHLYTNSKASRAEAIIEDLSLLLLAKLAIDVNGGSKVINDYLSSKKSANTVVLPMLRDTYPELVNSTQKFVIGEVAIRDAFSELNQINLTKAPSHTLGEAFQALMGPRLRGERGQFFTPRSLVRAMVEIVKPLPHENVIDPACGTGGFLSEVHQYQMNSGTTTEPIGELYGIDKDSGLARLAAALLKILTSGRSVVKNTNSLHPSTWTKNGDELRLGKV